MIEKQVQVIILIVDLHSLLSLDETEPNTEFEDKRLHLSQNGRFHILLGISIFESKEIQQIRARKTKSGVNLLSSCNAFNSISADFAGLRDKAVR